LFLVFSPPYGLKAIFFCSQDEKKRNQGQKNFAAAGLADALLGGSIHATLNTAQPSLPLNL